MSRILHIITGLGDGGAEAVLYRLCSADRDNDHCVISLMDGGKYGPLLVEAGIEVTSLGMPRGGITPTGLWKMWHIIRRIRPDTVQTWMYHANLLGGVAARLAGSPNICWGVHHSVLDPQTTSRRTMLVDRLSAKLSRLVPRLIVCCAEKTREVHARSGYDRKRMVVIPNGYDLASFRPDLAARTALRNELGLSETQLVIGFVARFHPVKDHATLIRALAFLRDADIRPICLLVGAGMDHLNTELTEIIATSGLSDQVRLLGSRADIPAVMNAIDLHVMSSITEGFPNVLAEAMACGTPCVSTDVGDAAEIVGETGCIVPPGDPAALATALAGMLEEKAGAEWADRQKAARQRIEEHFSMKQMIESYRAAWLTSQLDAGAPRVAART